jgi:pimeloyl-ACP methyl ester carboxylesterase
VTGTRLAEAVLVVIERRQLRVPVDDILPGVTALAAKTIIDRDRAGESAVVLCCYSGGGMSSRYFELDGFDMAGYLARAGLAVALIDHPAVGCSDTPVDPWLLTPDTVAAIEVSAARRLVNGLGFRRPTVIGVGHSMGAMLVAYQQDIGRLYSGLILIGYSGRGLPDVLEPDERAVADDPDRIRDLAAALARRRFREPLPAAGRGTGWLLTGPDPPAGALEALAQASAPLLAVCGLASLLPGAHTRQLASVDVPVLLAVAEHDIVGPPAELPGYFPAAPDVAVDVVPGAYHNSNVAPARHLLWDRVAGWARGVPGAEG